MATDTALCKSPSTSHVVRVTAGLGVTQLISWGTVFVPPPIFAASIAQDLQIELETVFLGITVMLLVSALVGPTLGRILDKVGSRQPMIYGALGASLGFLLLGSAPNTFVFWSAWIVLGLVAPLVLSNGCYAALSQLAGHRSRRAISSLTLFSGSAIAIFYPIAYFLDETIGWRSACLLFASLHLFISTPIFFSLIPRSKNAFASSTPPPGVHQPLEGRRRAIAFYALFILMAIHALVSNGLLLNFINLYEAFEIDKGVAVRVIALAGVLQILARLADILLSGRYPATVTILLSSLLQVLALLAILPAPSPAWIATLVIGICLSNGLMAIARAAVPLTLFGTRTYGEVMGQLSFPFNVMSALAPLIFAKLILASGPMAALHVATCLSVVGLVACFCVFETWRGRSGKRSRSDTARHSFGMGVDRHEDVISGDRGRSVPERINQP